MGQGTGPFLGILLPLCRPELRQARTKIKHNIRNNGLLKNTGLKIKRFKNKKILKNHANLQNIRRFFAHREKLALIFALGLKINFNTKKIQIL